jgi:hypothetical protein
MMQSGADDAEHYDSSESHGDGGGATSSASATSVAVKKRKMTGKEKAKAALAIVAAGGGVEGVDAEGNPKKQLTIAQIRELTGKYPLPGSVIGPASLERNRKIADLLWGFYREFEDWGIRARDRRDSSQYLRMSNCYEHVAREIVKLPKALNNGSQAWSFYDCGDAIAQRIDDIITNPLSVTRSLRAEYWPQWLREFKLQKKKEKEEKKKAEEEAAALSGKKRPRDDAFINESEYKPRPSKSRAGPAPPTEKEIAKKKGGSKKKSTASQAGAAAAGAGAE